MRGVGGASRLVPHYIGANRASASGLVVSSPQALGLSEVRPGGATSLGRSYRRQPRLGFGPCGFPASGPWTF